MKVQGAFNAMDYYFTTAFSCNSKLCGEKYVAKTS
jgi:hypothetical protein